MSGETSANGGLYEVMQVLNKINENKSDNPLATARQVDAKGGDATQEDMTQLLIAGETIKNMTSGT
ncbi:hypothetical protein ACFXDE_21220 [Kitasatospora sp. NPDC059408]|uniref:hypothetical protein n=1 Tax=Kitasatospora sp. NPDC059408 TaxID=3346823 RepID=UPI0036C221D1